LPDPSAQQTDNFQLDLRIIEQAQEYLFEGLVLLGFPDLVLGLCSILHRIIMP